MAITIQSDIITPQILEDAIRGVFRGQNAFMGSALVSSGAVMVRGTMPQGGRSAIGKTIDVPYFGTIGPMVNNPDGSAITPEKLGMTSEQATIARGSLAVETSRWAQGVAAVDPALVDPHDEGARQAMEQATRYADDVMTAAFAATPLVNDVFSTSNPVYLDHSLAVRSRAKFGDEQETIVAMVTHSEAEADLASMQDDQGRPLYVQSIRESPQGRSIEKTFAGMRLLVSDRVPLTGSSMSAVTAAGTTPPAVTVAGTPLGPWALVIDIVTGGLSNGTATFRFSTDGGNTWSATLTVPNGGGAILLSDTAIDSLVGANGKTGITATFANGTYNADNTYTANAILKVTSMICQAGAGAFWYNADALIPKRDEDILADADILALHLYHASLLYRRRRGGSRPGVVAIKHNVRNWSGQ